MPSFTVSYSSDAQEGAAASGQGFPAVDLQGAGPPPFVDAAAADGGRNFDDLKGAGPPPVPGLVAAISTSGARDDLGEAGPPPITPA